MNQEIERVRKEAQADRGRIAELEALIFHLEGTIKEKLEQPPPPPPAPAPPAPPPAVPVMDTPAPSVVETSDTPVAPPPPPPKPASPEHVPAPESESVPTMPPSPDAERADDSVPGSSGSAFVRPDALKSVFIADDEPQESLIRGPEVNVEEGGNTPGLVGELQGRITVLEGALNELGALNVALNEELSNAVGDMEVLSTALEEARGAPPGGADGGFVAELDELEVTLTLSPTLELVVGID